MPDSYQNPYVNRRHMGGGGRRNQLRYHPDPYYAGSIIESGAPQGYSQFGVVDSGTTVVAVIPLHKANGVRIITKLNVHTRVSTSSGAANVHLYEVGGTPESAIATGSAVDEDLAFVFADNSWNEITLDGGDYVPDTGSMLAIRFTHTGGTSFQLSGKAGQSQAGARVMWADTVATPIQDTVWEEFDCITPYIQVQYDDNEREGFHVSFAANSAGNTPIHGAIATGGCAGIGIQPDEDLPFNYIECFISTDGTTTSAGVARLYIYDENKNFLWKSVNTYDSATGCFSSSARRKKGFEFEDNTLERGSKYYIVLAQDATGGSASHNLRLGGGVTTAYVDGAAPPRDFDENNYHGMFSVSSTTGVANLASNVVTGHFFRILRKPLTRTSQVFT